MKVLVAGGSGFIGSRFCSLIKRNGHTFEILDKNPSAFYSDQVRIVDVRLPIEIASSAEVLINLAAEHRDDVYPISLYDETNVNY